MQNNFKKVFLIVPMILFLCISFMGTIAKAEDKVTSNQSQDYTNSTGTENQTSKTSSILETSGSSKSVSNTKDNQNSISTTNKTDQETNVLSEWKKIDGKLHYVTKDGIVEKTGWFKEKDENPNANDDNVYYLDKDFAATIGWKKINGAWYYFDEAGIEQTGWKLINYNWYYFGKDGIMATGWIKDDGYTYYLNNEGIMDLGKKFIDNNWYFFGSAGILQKGFYEYKGKSYYSDNNGIMVANQWIKTKNDQYYVKADSSLATGYAIIDNEAEKFDSNGRYIGPAEMEAHLYINQLSVGEADCAFIKLPSGETALIDTGTPETAQKVISFLDGQNLKEEGGKKVIDYIIITHAHSDHIGGLAAILDNFNVKKVYMPDNAMMKDWYSYVKVTADNSSNIKMMKTDYKVYQDAVSAMKSKKIKFTNTKKGEFIDNNKILQFVQSDKDFGPIGSDKDTANYWGVNENSAIIYLNYGDLKELFAADMEWNSEKDFWTNDLLDGKKVDVLKVPHHGHDTSSTSDFIQYLSPSIGIISRDKKSIEKNSAYNNLIANGVSIYETSEKDGVSIYATQENWTVGK
ncbi:MBL fold metallo-hydrolase [Clostridium sp.]|uniref:MBL fold metallo-hydrolase n=1 Tax=Clostridium sp. TaxID=1506 RepID=UPI002623B603|nr:MBL fold metallo-hydrolase [Clostridium sp.]